MSAAITLEAIIEFLLQTPLFARLDAAELGDLVRIMQIQSVRAGVPVFREGDGGDGWYVLFEGEVEVTKESSFGPDRIIATLGDHACFGEMAVIDGSQRSANVVAVEDSTLFRFPREPFQDLLSDGNLGAYKLVYAMARVLCDRQRAVTQQLSEVLADEEIERRALDRQLGSIVQTHTVSE